MPQALITVNAVAGSDVDVPINVLVQLGNQGVGGELTYAWTLVDQPPGAADALSSASSVAPTFTPKKEGTYLLNLVVNASLASESVDRVVVAVRQLKTRTRVPAATEDNEAGAVGWAEDVDALLRLVDTLRADPGLQVCQVAGASVAVGTVVKFPGTATLKSGLPGQETVLTVDLALATLSTNLDEPLGLVVAAVDGGAVGVGALVYVRRFGLQTGLTIGGSPASGDPLFVTDAGGLSKNAGTVRRQVGRCYSASAAYFDGATYDYVAATALSNNAPLSIDPDDAASAGVGAAASRDDHQHAIVAAIAGGILVGDTAAEGAATSFSRSDHRHALGAPAAPANVTKAAASAGASTNVAREDHKHDVTTAAAVALTDSTNAEGSASSLARSDHTHSHGARAGGTLHADATTSVAGFLPAADKVKLNSQLVVDLAAMSAAIDARVQTFETSTTDATPTDAINLGPLSRSALAFISVDQAAGGNRYGFFLQEGALHISSSGTDVTDTEVKKGGALTGVSVAWIENGSSELVLQITGEATSNLVWRGAILHWETA